MRPVAGSLLGVACLAGSLFAATRPAVSAIMVAPPAKPTTALVPIEYFCSPGFEPRGGACVAVPSRAEIELFVDQPIYDAPAPYRRHRRHHRKGLRERF